MNITIKEVEELIKNGVTSDKKYKLDYQSPIVENKLLDKDFSYFDLLFKDQNKKVFFCCIHLVDLDKDNNETIDIVEMC